MSMLFFFFWSCDCFSIQDWPSHVDKMDIIFIGILRQAELTDSGGVNAQFEILEVFKGDFDESKRFYTDDSEAGCGVPMFMSKYTKYLVFSKYEGRFSICNGSTHDQGPWKIFYLTYVNHVLEAIGEPPRDLDMIEFIQNPKAALEN